MAIRNRDETQHGNLFEDSTPVPALKIQVFLLLADSDIYSKLKFINGTIKNRKTLLSLVAVHYGFV